jgi:hypothetical protein
VVRYAGDFDPGLVTVADAARILEHAAVIEKVAATVKGLAAARVAETSLWRQAGDRSTAHHLARTTGSSVGAAAEAREAARRLGGLPTLGAAARRGELSGAQVAAIADAASADPGAETRLVERARGASLSELRDDCARTKAGAEPDPEARRARIHARRYLRAYTDAEGAWNLAVRNNPEVGAQVMAGLEPIVDRIFRAARAEGRREPLEAYAADALAELARGAGTDTGEARADGTSTSGPRADGPRGPGRAKIIVRVDLGTLLRGYPVTGETCEFCGYGPVAVSAVRDLIESGDPFLAAVATKGEAVVGVAHLGRRPTARQQSALEWLYPACAAEGCPALGQHLQTDHRVDWADTHYTMVDLLDRLCGHDHHLKTHEGWALVEGHGKRPFVPPDDPRHPRHHPRPPPEHQDEANGAAPAHRRRHERRHTGPA